MHAVQTATPVPADVIRRAREAKGLTQRRFAKELGKSQAVLSRYEAGRVDPPADVLMHCVHILLPESPALLPIAATVSADLEGIPPPLGAAMAAVRDAMAALRAAIETLHDVAVLNGDTALRDDSNSPSPLFRAHSKP